MRLPPEPSTCENYSLWRKDIEIWAKLTDTAPNKRGAALQYTCRTNKKIHEAIVNIPEDEVDCPEGLEKVLTVLDGLHNVDKKEAAVQCYEEFLSLKRRPNQQMAEFIQEFATLADKTTSHGNKLSDDLLAFRLMQAVNISEFEERMIKSSCPEFTIEHIVSVLKRAYPYSESIGKSVEVKTEPLYFANGATESDGHQLQDEDSVYYGASNWRGNKKNQNKGNYLSKPSSKPYQFSIKQPLRRGKNPLDKQGNITQCHTCYSINHWANDCPDKSDDDESPTLYNVVFFEDDYDQPDNIKSLVHETMGCAVLDCGAAKSVCGQNWLNSYLEILTEQDRNKIIYSNSSSTFKFGYGNKVKATRAVQMPITLGSKKVQFKTDVVEEDLPLLFSRMSMKRANTQLDTSNDTATMLGEKIPLMTTTSGHYAIPICTSKTALESKARVNLMTTVKNRSPQEIAHKLHRQFAHPPPERLIKLLDRSDYKSKEINELIHEESKNCDVCKRYKRPPPRPVVGMPLSTRFNQTVSMDIKFIKGKPVLHLIDDLTRYSMSSVLANKQAKTVINNIFKWISMFGSPGMFLSGNGGEFANHEFTEMGERFNIRVNTTAAESPWANGLCERYNAVLEDMVNKIMEEVQCSLEVAVVWANSAKNSLLTVHGFSPAQLVFGFNPMLPCTQNDKPPALSTDEAYSDIVEENLRAMRSARAAMIKTESSEKVRRALNHNIRSSGDVKYLNGDLVYFKRKDDKQWHGPATVIGQDGQMVLLRNHFTWVRVHPCRLQLVQDCQNVTESFIKSQDADYTYSKVKGSPVAQQDIEDEEEETRVPVLEKGVENSPDNETREDNNIRNLMKTIQEADNNDQNNDSVVIEDQPNKRIEIVEIEDNQDINPEQATSNNKDKEAKRTKPKPTYNKAIKFKDILKKDENIKFKYHDDEEWKTGKLISRSGTVRGKYPNEWNCEVNGNIEQIDFDKEIEAVEINLTPDYDGNSEEIETFFTQVFQTELKELFEKTVEKTLSYYFNKLLKRKRRELLT